MAYSTLAAQSVGSPGQPVSPQSFTGVWQGVITGGRVATQDAATITNPETEITNAASYNLKRGGRGTFLALRLAYDDGLTSITNPVVKVFGRTSSDAWQLLKTRASALSATLTTAATDAQDGTLKYTTPDIETHVWDCFGCEEIIVGVETALAGTGTTANSIIQAKLF